METDEILNASDKVYFRKSLVNFIWFKLQLIRVSYFQEEFRNINKFK